MNGQRSVEEYGIRGTTWIYVLALVLAAVIAALHAAVLFGLADLLVWLDASLGNALGQRLTGIVAIVTVVSGLFAAHLAETGVWAVFFWKSGRLESFGDGWYFAGVSHTTLGYGDVVLGKPWRSLGPISAINGLLTFGCSTAFLFLVLQDIWQRNF